MFKFLKKRLFYKLQKIKKNNNLLTKIKTKIKNKNKKISNKFYINFSNSTNNNKIKKKIIINNFFYAKSFKNNYNKLIIYVKLMNKKFSRKLNYN